MKTEAKKKEVQKSEKMIWHFIGLVVLKSVKNASLLGLVVAATLHVKINVFICLGHGIVEGAFF